MPLHPMKALVLPELAHVSGEALAYIAGDRLIDLGIRDAVSRSNRGVRAAGDYADERRDGGERGKGSKATSDRHMMILR